MNLGPGPSVGSMEMGVQELRVILLGRTGLDAALRRDTTLELVRTRSPLDALGEVAGARSIPAVVIVDAESEPRRAGTGSLAEFVAGLRRVRPDVRVLRVGRGDEPTPSEYDGVIDPSRAAESLHELAARAPGVEVKPAAREELPARQPVADEPGPTAAACVPIGADPGDEPLARALADGEEIRARALEMIAARLGGAEVRLSTGTDVVEPGWPHWASAPVSIGGAPAGVLRARGVEPGALSAHASWLGAWLGLAARHKELHDAAYKDQLTGAWNRRAFDEHLALVLEEARRERLAVTLLAFDIDDFKRFNDTHGHAWGDEILRETTRLITSVIRPGDRVCRVGGDEFAVVFFEPGGPRAPNSRPPASVFDIAERFQSRVRSAQFRRLGDEAPGRLTISGGLATYPWDGRTPAELLARADELSMQSKRQGKNAIVYGPDARRVGEG